MTGRNAAQVALCLFLVAIAAPAAAVTTVTHPYQGVTFIDRREASVAMHIVMIDLRAPGIRFKLSPHAGTRETCRQATTDFIRQEHAQIGINAHFFDPVSTGDFNVNLAGLAVAQGTVVSTFEGADYSQEFGTNQSYAIVPYAPGLNIDPSNHVSIVHRDPAYADNKHTIENVTLWNALAGSAQIITDGVKTIPSYKDADHPDGQLASLKGYSNANSWYNLAKARTAIGFTRDRGTLVLFTVDAAGGNAGMSAGAVADILMNDYHVYNALNLDGGGSTCLAMQDPITHQYAMMNVSADGSYPGGRPEGASLAVFAQPAHKPSRCASTVFRGHRGGVRHCMPAK